MGFYDSNLTPIQANPAARIRLADTASRPAIVVTATVPDSKVSRTPVNMIHAGRPGNAWAGRLMKS